MAAALLRGGLCARCIHREVCRVVWRPQTALFSSKPSDRKQPRRTHIKKAKHQPSVDVAKLLEQLFSEKRPGTASPAGKARPAQASSTRVSTSSVPPLSKTAASVVPAASSLPNKNTDAFKTAALSSQPEPASPTTPKTSSYSETPQQLSLGFTQAFTADRTVATNTTSALNPTSTTPASVAPIDCQTSEMIETKVAEQPVLFSSANMQQKNEETSFSPAAAVEAIIETAVESPVEASLPPVEDKSIDSRVVDFTQTTKEEASIETTIESSVETGTSLEIRAAVAESAVDATVEAPAEEVQTKSIDSGVIDFTQTAEEEPLIETTVEPSVEVSASGLEILESRAAVAESTVEFTVDAPAEEVRTVSTESGVIDFTQTTKEEALIETTMESSVETGTSLEIRAAVAESAVDATVEAPVEEVQTKSIDSGVIDFTQTAKEEPLIETAVESSVEVNISPLENRAAVAGCPVEPTVETAADTVADSLSHTTLIQIMQEPAAVPLEIESTVESTVESASGNVADELVNNSEDMNLESVTLSSVKVLVESFKADELLQTKSVLDEKAEERLQELLVQTGIEHKAAAETENSALESESEILTKVLPKWESLPEDLQELEGETGMLVKELLCHVPVVLSKTSFTVKTSSNGANGDFVHVEDEKQSKAEAMTLESITLADVKAEVGSLESKLLQETKDALEKEAVVFAGEEQMEMEREDVADFEDTTEAEILTLDISEVTAALEVETAVMLESMFGSEQGLTQPPDDLLVDKKKQEEAIVQEAEKEPREQDGSVLEAMSLESVTLAEIEASLGTLETEPLNETTAYLEEEAEVLAGGMRVEVEDGAASEDMTEALTVESLSLHEADALNEALQTDALMEELLFSVPGHVADVKESQIGQEVVREDILDATVATGSGTADTLAAETDDLPAQEEVLLGQEEEEKEEEGAQTEDVEIEESTGTHADLDPVQRLFLEKIREYNMRRLSGDPVELGADYEKSLSEETVKLQRLYGGGDLSSFPQFTFTEPTMDEDSK